MKKNQFIKRAAKAGILTILAFAGLLVSVGRSPAQTKKIIFLAGPKDHGAPGRHEYEKDLRVLARCLDSSNIKGITTEVIVARTPKDISDIKGAAAIVVLSSSDGSTQKQTHPLFPPPGNGKNYDRETMAYLKDLDSLQKAGMGVVVLHWAVQAQNWAARKVFFNWFGGMYIPENNSNNPGGIWNMIPVESNKKHPILRGVEPWQYQDEIFANYMVVPQDPNRTDLIMGEMRKENNPGVSRNGQPARPSSASNRVVAFSYQRDSGSRGVMFGGVDYHKDMLEPNYLRFILNSIVWAAQIEVPKKGVITTAKQLQ